MPPLDTIFVGSGGGNKGCLQAGHIRAVRDWIDWSSGTVRLKAVSGTSIGAFNTSLWAAGVSDRDIRAFWLNAGIRSFGTFNWKFLWAAMHFAADRHQGYILDPHTMRKFLATKLPETWGGFAHPLYIGVSAYSRSGKEILSTENNGTPADPEDAPRNGACRRELLSISPLDAVMTSAAIPGVFPQLRYAESYWGDAGCMLNKIPILDDLCTPKTVTVISVLGYAGLTQPDEQAEFWPWEWAREGREKVNMEEYQQEIYGWGEQVSEHVFRSPTRGWLVVIHNKEGRKLAPYDFSQCAALYGVGHRYAQTILSEFEGVYDN